MSGDIYQIIAIFLYMALMVFIGYYSYKKTSNLTDYMLGGRSLGPAVTALSAGAADMSGGYSWAYQERFIYMVS